jgi:hypothetical protein
MADTLKRAVSSFRSFCPRAICHGISSVALLAAVLGSAALGHAQCTIDVVGPESAAWLHAADELDFELSEHAGASRCQAVVVEAYGGQAKLTYTANDGRTAERQIEDPLELLPTVQALSAEGPRSSLESPPAAATSPMPAKAPSPKDQIEQPQAQAESKPYDLHPLFGAQVGFRAGADHLISPCVGLFGAVPIDRWELGIVGRFEAHYVSTLGGNENVPETSTVAFGVTAGRREPLGVFQMRAGVTGLLAAIHEDKGNKRGQAEARLGAYGGAVLPLHGRLGLRGDLAFELVPYSIGRSQTNATGVYSLPWWGVTSVIGVEIN